MKDAHELVSKLKELTHEIGQTPTMSQFLNHFGLSRYSVDKLGGFIKLCDLAGTKARGTNQHVKANEEATNQKIPKICYFDEEISSMEVKVYQLRQKGFIHHGNITKNWHFLSWAAIFEHDPETFHYLDQRFAANVQDDRQLIEGLHHTLSEADIISGHNVKRFDLKKFNTRCALYDLPPIHGKIIWDTLPLYKKHFDLPSYSLGFIAKYFNFKNQKLEHSGDMWDRCLNGELAAWIENEFYNKGDCKVSREALHFIARFEPSINLQPFTQKPVCFCGSSEFFRDGEAATKQGLFPVFRCRSCLAPYTGKENLIDEDLRKGFFK